MTTPEGAPLPERNSDRPGQSPVDGEEIAIVRHQVPVEDGTVIEVRGDEEIDYDGEIHTAANLFDAIKDGYYGRM